MGHWSFALEGYGFHEQFDLCSHFGKWWYFTSSFCLWVAVSTCWILELYLDFLDVKYYWLNFCPLRNSVFVPFSWACDKFFLRYPWNLLTRCIVTILPNSHRWPQSFLHCCLAPFFPIKWTLIFQDRMCNFSKP
jgi:hypothetical protein